MHSRSIEVGYPVSTTSAEVTTPPNSNHNLITLVSQCCYVGTYGGGTDNAGVGGRKLHWIKVHSPTENARGWDKSGKVNYRGGGINKV